MIQQSKTIAFNKMFNPQTNKVIIKENAESIQHCLSMLLSTCKGELLGDPDFGTNIKKYLMNYQGVVLQDKIKSDIIENIEKYEKRIIVTHKDIDIKTDENNCLYITISFLDLSNGQRKDFNLTF